MIVQPPWSKLEPHGRLITPTFSPPTPHTSYPHTPHTPIPYTQTLPIYFTPIPYPHTPRKNAALIALIPLTPIRNSYPIPHTKDPDPRAPCPVTKATPDAAGPISLRAWASRASSSAASAAWRYWAARCAPEPRRESRGREAEVLVKGGQKSVGEGLVGLVWLVWLGWFVGLVGLARVWLVGTHPEATGSQ